MSMVTLTIAATMFTQYWGSGFGVTPVTFVLLLVIIMMSRSVPDPNLFLVSF
jgi:uncharacterized membrane protein YjjP (DUF1212 family)